VDGGEDEGEEIEDESRGVDDTGEENPGAILVSKEGGGGCGE